MAADPGEVLLTSIRETDLITWTATVTAVIYVFLALKENAWCWSFGIVSSALSVGVLFHEELIYEAVLNVFYVVLGIYGWIKWSKDKGAKDSTAIGRIPSKELLYACALAVFCGVVLGYIRSHNVENHFAYLDALTATFAVIATWMTAKKYIENWIFWIAIDAVSAVLFFLKGPQMYIFALLFIFYTFMAAAGYVAWKKSLKA